MVAVEHGRRNGPDTRPPKAIASVGFWESVRHGEGEGWLTRLRDGRGMFRTLTVS